MTPIVVVGYNRPRSLARLLNSINAADFDSNDVLLIISIDKGDNQDVLQVAEDFDWKHGKKDIRYQPENLKLRKHILKCGDISQEYGSVIILEDDLFVSKEFYRYATKALDFVKDDPKIGGVSLYNHLFNVNVCEPFSALPDGYDNWYFQFASSWGQAWTAEQWKQFKLWYGDNNEKDITGYDIPVTVTSWSSSSWLKYFIKYLIVTDRYFLYPRESLTTNFSDAGTHAEYNGTNYQVPLQVGEKEYRFSTLKESKSVYDAFFENRYLSDMIGLDENVDIDLYGSKQGHEYRYKLTSKILNYKILKGYARSMRPMDANIVYNIEGKEFFLYDTSISETNEYKVNQVQALEYCIRNYDKKTYKVFLKKFTRDLKNYIKKRI